MLCRTCTAHSTAYARALHVIAPLSVPHPTKPSRPTHAVKPPARASPSKPTSSTKSTPPRPTRVATSPKSSANVTQSNITPTTKPKPLALPSAKPITTSTPLRPTQTKPLIQPEEIPDWPWIPLPNSKTGHTIEERVIFARPFENARGKKFNQTPILCVVFIVFGGVVIWADVELGAMATRNLEIEKYRQIPIENRGMGETFAYYLRVATPYLTATAVAGGLAASVSIFNSHLKTVVKLSLMRATPADGQGHVTEVVRLAHGLHAIKPGRPYRDIPKEQIKIRFSNIYMRSSKLTMNIEQPKVSKYLAFRNTNYQLNFADSAPLKRAEEEGQDVILSFKRIEAVFGEIGGVVAQIGSAKGLMGLINKYI